MALNSVVFVITLSCIIFGLSESRGFEFGSQSDDGASPFLANPNIKKAILHALLSSRGSSLDRIHDVTESAHGNVDLAVNGINSELKDNVLQLVSDAIKVNPVALKDLFQSSIQSIITQRLSHIPALASQFQKCFDQQINAHLSELKDAVERSVIPLSVAQQYLSSPRAKRSLEPRDFDLTSIITDLVTSIIADQIASMISAVLDSVKSTLNGMLILVAPDDFIGQTLAGIVNFIVKGLIEIITMVQAIISPASQLAPASAQIRVRRDLGDLTDVVQNAVDSATGDSSNILEILVGPILALLGSIFDPTALLVKALITLVLNTIGVVL